MRVLIVGSGIFGLCTALECVERGMDVTLVEAGSIPCSSASSHDAHRLIRHPYGPMRGYARLVPEAYRCWDALWDAFGHVLYEKTGTLAVGDPSTAWVEHSAASLEELGVAFERLSPAAARERYPFVSVRDVKDVLYTPEGGVLLADRILRAAADLLATRGGRLLDCTPVDGPEDLGRLAADARADAVVISTGSWASVPSAFAEYAVTPTRQVVGYLHDPPDELVGDREGRGPMILDLDKTSGFYLVPSVRGTPAKIGDHVPGREDADERLDAPTDEERLRLSHLFEGALGRPVPDTMSFGLCRYAMTADRRFILREGKRLSGRPGTRVLVAGGGSGHGFKFGPLIGQLVADVVDLSLDISDGERIAAGYVERRYFR